MDTVSQKILFLAFLRVSDYFFKVLKKNYNYITSKQVTIVNEGEISSKIENVKEYHIK